MRGLHSSLTLFLTCAVSTSAYVLGPVYPAPRDLSSNSSRVVAAWNNLTSVLETHIRGNQSNQDASSQLGDLTFSAGLFSLHDPEAQSIQFHHTSPEILNASAGTNEVDGDSIYRVASVSKLFTVLAGLLTLDEDDWERPFTEIFPELAEFARDNTDPARFIQWDQVTPRALAANMAGVQSGGLLITDILLDQAGATEAALELGLPPLDPNDPANTSPCFLLPAPGLPQCTPAQYAAVVSSDSPVFPPWTSPSYANNGFVLLGLAIANLTGQPMHDIYRENIFAPLSMDSSNSLPPSNDSDLSRYVIAGDPAIFIADNGITIPSGGLFSTINDLAILGSSILNSTLMPLEMTRRWMKPVSHTADLRHSVGSPWEIYRYTHATSGVVTDIYTKLGDSGPWAGLLAVIPDFDAGFSILSTASEVGMKSNMTLLVADIIMESILPALMDQSALEGELNFAGTYSSTEEGLDSSLTLAVDPTDTNPGLSISSWTSNGTDLMPLLASILGSPDARMVPTVPAPSASGGQLAFRPYSPTFNPNAGAFSGFYDVGDWVITGSISTYSGIGLSHFIFETDPSGRATAVTPLAYVATLDRE